jgi:hypothetical protein
MRAVFVAVILACAAVPANAAAETGDEAAVRSVVADWYAGLRRPKRTHWMLYAPGGIDGGPEETELYPDIRARSPTISNELAAKALQFAYDIDAIVVDPHLARVWAWERGYFYAWATDSTYELAASTLFVLERQTDGRWLILAHEARSVGIPSTKRTDPLPDMEPVWKARRGDVEASGEQ